MQITRRKTGWLLLGWFLFGVAFLLALEFATLSDAIPLNHITAIVRVAFHAEPGVWIWLAFSGGFLCGHLFWGGKE